MRNAFVILCFLAGVAGAAQAQTPDRPIKWIVKPSAHVFVPFHRAASVPDQLVSYNGPQYSFTVVSAARYFGNVGFHVDFYSGARLTPMSQKFADKLRDTYGSEYYVKNSSLPENPPLGRLMFGLGYKFENGRWFFLTKMMLGSMAYSVQSGSAALKRINSNERRTISWEAVDQTDFSAFTFNTGVTAGYRINNALALSFDAGYWAHGSGFTIKEHTAILNGGNATTKFYEYAGTKGEFNLGVGVMVTW